MLDLLNISVGSDSSSVCEQCCQDSGIQQQDLRLLVPQPHDDAAPQHDSHPLQLIGHLVLLQEPVQSHHHQQQQQCGQW